MRWLLSSRVIGSSRRFVKPPPKSGADGRWRAFFSTMAATTREVTIPEGVNILPTSVPVGSQMLHAVGIGYAMKYRKEKNVAMTFFGDGATSQGDFHEAMNYRLGFSGTCHIRVPEQSLGHFTSTVEADPLPDHRPKSAGLRHARDPGGWKRHPGSLQSFEGCGRAGQNRRRPDIHRDGYLSAVPAHNGGRSQKIPTRAGSRGMGKAGPHPPLREIS